MKQKISDFLITYALLFICCLMDLRAINFQTFIRPLVLSVTFIFVFHFIKYILNCISNHTKK